MKKLLIPFFLVAALATAHAGGSCCSKGGENSDKKGEKAEMSESAITISGSDEKNGDCCKKSCGSQSATTAIWTL